MPIKKSDLYSSLWRSCDELRGGMDASQYKDYVLVLLFVKYVSDKYAGQKDALLDVPKGGGFADMVALKGDKEIGDRINKIIGRLAEANDLKGVIDVADFNDADKLGRGKEMVDRLSNLVSIFDNPALDFRGNRAEGDDLLGDAYEYLMRHFATESGKSKGQFYTPAEVSRIMAKVISIGSARSASQSVHDPTCGSASLLLKAHDEARSMTGLDLTLYGQEMDNATAALARMNMILHDCPTAEIWKDNVLSSPHFKLADETAEEIGKCVAFLDDLEVYAGGDIVAFSPNGQNSMFLGYLMNHSTVASQKARMGQGDAVVHISAKNLAELELRLPKPDEQTAIATVLSDMDAELAAHEACRDKTRALKQCMMQELLTGRTRLV